MTIRALLIGTLLLPFWFSIALASAQDVGWNLQAPAHPIAVEPLPATLADVRRVAVGPEGQFALLFARSGEIARVDPDGSIDSVHSFGPGAISQIGFSGDTLWVGRASQPVIVMLDGDDPAEIQRGLMPTDAGMRPVPAAALLEGGMALAQPLPTGYQLTRSGSGEHPLVLLSPDNAVVDTLAVFRSVEGLTVLPGAGILMYQPFPDDLLWRAAPGGDFVVIIDGAPPASASTSKYSLTSFSADGRTRWSRPVEFTPRPVSQGTRDSVLETALSLANARAGTEGAREIEQAINIPRFHAPVYQLLVGTTGEIWLRESWSGDPGQRWIVFDESGERLRTVDVEPGLEVWGVADSWVWATAEMDGRARLIQIPFPR